ncbi:MAG: fibrobacter succinogenes major paralogous domain-containing protein [Chitinophagales bacterium]
MKNINHNSILLFAVLSFCSCFNSYDEVEIGDQIWMSKNLNVDKFRNGDPIPHAKNIEEWLEYGENKGPAWCYFNNDKSNSSIHGKLYNYYAVVDPRGLAPEGWRIPSYYDWSGLAHYYGGWDKAKHRITGENSKFKAYYSGRRVNVLGTEGFLEKGGAPSAAYWWVSPPTPDSRAAHVLLSNSFFRYDADRSVKAYYGNSVRCIR